jgi:hypothetical protein
MDAARDRANASCGERASVALTTIKELRRSQGRWRVGEDTCVSARAEAIPRKSVRLMCVNADGLGGC